MKLSKGSCYVYSVVRGGAVKGVFPSFQLALHKSDQLPDDLIRIKEEASHDGEVNSREQVDRLAVDGDCHHFRVEPPHKVGDGEAHGNDGALNDATPELGLVELPGDRETAKRLNRGWTFLRDKL